MRGIEDRETCLRTVMMVKHELGEEGFDIADEAAQRAAVYDAKDQRRVWESRKNDPGGPLLTYANLFW